MVLEDYKAFQLQPDWIFKNKFSLLYQKYLIGIIHKIESGMQLTTMSRSGFFYYDELPLRNNIDFYISTDLDYRFFKSIIELSILNILPESTQIDDFILFVGESRFKALVLL